MKHIVPSFLLLVGSGLLGAGPIATTAAARPSGRAECRWEWPWWTSRRITRSG